MIFKTALVAALAGFVVGLLVLVLSLTLVPIERADRTSWCIYLDQTTGPTIELCGAERLAVSPETCVTQHHPDGWRERPCSMVMGPTVREEGP